MFSVGLSAAMEVAASAIDFETIGAWFAGIWIAVAYYGEKLIAFLFTYGKEIIGVLGGAYGILNWWYYRESVLHYRLEKYLDREDIRLRNARRDVLYTLARPGERRQFAEPKFAVAPLRKILRRRHLDSRWSWRLPESEADRALADALKRISRQTEVLDKTQNLYREQTVTAHIFKGVVAALKAQRSPSNAAVYRTSALQEFRTALAIPGGEHRLFVLEQIGHQLRCLGMLDASADAYSALLTETDLLPPGKSRDLARARALKWRAVVHQAIRWYDAAPGNGALRAFDGVGQGLGINGAIDALAQHTPLREWDAIEYGDTLYIAAFIASNLGFTNVEAQRLSDARAAYSSAQISSSRPLWRMRGKEKMLAKAARPGLARVEQAQRGDYDLAWLLPPGAPPAAPSPSNAPENPPQPVGGGGGQDGVAKAT